MDRRDDLTQLPPSGYASIPRTPPTDLLNSVLTLPIDSICRVVVRSGYPLMYDLLAARHSPFHSVPCCVTGVQYKNNVSSSGPVQ